MMWHQANIHLICTWWRFIYTVFDRFLFFSLHQILLICKDTIFLCLGTNIYTFSLMYQYCHIIMSNHSISNLLIFWYSFWKNSIWGKIYSFPFPRGNNLIFKTDNCNNEIIWIFFSSMEFMANVLNDT